MAKSNKAGYQRLVEDGGRCDMAKTVARFCFMRGFQHVCTPSTVAFTVH